jgi:acetyl esterase/lipase
MKTGSCAAAAAALVIATLAASCGSSEEAEALVTPAPTSGPAGSGGAAGAPIDAAVDEQESSAPGDDAADASPVDAAVEEAAAPVVDPYQPPAGDVVTWKGKLPPGGWMAPDIWVTFPKNPPAGTTLPLVVFAHGFQMGVGDYLATCQHLARFGYVVASVDYASNMMDQDHHAPVDSMKAAIELLLGQPPAEVGKIADADRIAAMGHSLGAKGAVWAALEDARIKAVVALDPVDDDPSPVPVPSPKRPSLAPEQMGKMKVPVLYLGAELSPTGTPPCAPAKSNACRFAESTPQTTPHWVAVLAKTGHMQFADNFNCALCWTCAKGAEADDPAVKLAFRGLSVALLESALRGKTGYLAYLEGAEFDKLRAQSRVLDAASQDKFCAPP